MILNTSETSWVKMRDVPKFPFCHGYVVTGILAGFI